MVGTDETHACEDSEDDHDGKPAVDAKTDQLLNQSQNQCSEGSNEAKTDDSDLSRVQLVEVHVEDSELGSDGDLDEEDTDENSDAASDLSLRRLVLVPDEDKDEGADKADSEVDISQFLSLKLGNEESA